MVLSRLLVLLTCSCTTLVVLELMEAEGSAYRHVIQIPIGGFKILGRSPIWPG